MVMGGASALLLGEADAGLVELIQSAKGSVVAVGTFNPLASPRFAFRGTGFVVGDGRQVVTNAHVLPPSGGAEPAGQLVIVLPRGGDSVDMRKASLQAQAAEFDLAVLRFDGAAAPALALGEPDGVREGQSVALIGFPLGAGLGLTPVTHRGIIAAITPIAMPSPTATQLDARTASRLRKGSFDVYQLDATAYPGSSGSPVFDIDSGQVVGIVNMVLVKGTKESAISAPTGITFAIPARWVTELMAARKPAGP
jgi:S1-C subfamily serine protease